MSADIRHATIRSLTRPEVAVGVNFVVAALAVRELSVTGWSGTGPLAVGRLCDGDRCSRARLGGLIALAAARGRLASDIAAGNALADDVPARDGTAVDRGRW